MFKKLFIIAMISISVLSPFGLATKANAQEETEPAGKSNITFINLPAGAVRVLEPSVPQEIRDALSKLVEAGEGKIVQGDSEVLAWTGGDYRKSKASQLMREVENNLQNTGWTFEIGKQNNEFIVFSVLRSVPKKRGALGFFVPTDDALLLAWTEVLPSDTVNTETKIDNKTDGPTNTKNNSRSLKDLVGKWEKKQSGQSYKGQNGNYVGSSGNYESYTFFADGRVEYSTLIAVQNYGCRIEAFAQNKGRASINGSNIIISFTGGSVRRDDSCSKSKNYTKPLPASSATFGWKTETDDYGVVQFCLTQADGQTFCYRREK